jgi:hypothetical protein
MDYSFMNSHSWVRLIVLATLVFSLGFGLFVAVGVAVGQTVEYGPTDLVLYQVGDRYNTGQSPKQGGLYYWDRKRHVGYHFQTGCQHKGFRWSPNGSKIALAAICSNEVYIFLLTTNAKRITPVARANPLFGYMHWGGEQRIFYDEFGSGGIVLSETDIHTQATTPYILSEFTTDEMYRLVAVLQDGRYFTAHHIQSKSDFIFDTRTREAVALTPTLYPSAMSGDGKKRAYFVQEGTEMVLMIEGRPQPRLFSFPFDPERRTLSGIVWSPDNRFIVFSLDAGFLPHNQNATVLVVNVETGEMKVVEGVVGAVHRFLWHKGSKRLSLLGYTTNAITEYVFDVEDGVSERRPFQLPENVLMYEFRPVG